MCSLVEYKSEYTFFSLLRLEDDERPLSVLSASNDFLM